jgi:hypothetical protein|tara:strand:+ start:1122 stop:1274 length:153 start_codon:yes stop_codon:yes gene_type:complete
MTAVEAFMAIMIIFTYFDNRLAIEKLETKEEIKRQWEERPKGGNPLSVGY